MAITGLDIKIINLDRVVNYFNKVSRKAPKTAKEANENAATKVAFYMRRFAPKLSGHLRENIYVVKEPITGGNLSKTRIETKTFMPYPGEPGTGKHQGRQHAYALFVERGFKARGGKQVPGQFYTKRAVIAASQDLERTLPFLVQKLTRG